MAVTYEWFLETIDGNKGVLDHEVVDTLARLAPDEIISAVEGKKVQLVLHRFDSNELDYPSTIAHVNNAGDLRGFFSIENHGKARFKVPSEYHAELEEQLKVIGFVKVDH